MVDNRVINTAHLELLKESVKEKYGINCANVMECLALGLSKRRTASTLGIRYKEVLQHVETLTTILSAAYQI